jgi:hypothetical protein
MGTDLSSAPPYSGRNDVSYTSVEEAQQGKGPEGQQAPAGTKPVAVEHGDTISSLMAKQGLDWNDPEDRAQFLRDNPQFAEAGGDRNPDLIWPGEVLYIRTGPAQDDGTGDSGETTTPATDTDGDGIPDPQNASEAQATTDAAAKDLERAEQQQSEYLRGPGPKGMKHEYEAQVAAARERLAEAFQAEIETGLRDYMAKNPDATPEQIEAEAERLGNQIQGRSQELSGIADSTVDYRTQQAINVVSAEARGINLAGIAPGTTVRDGPYTDSYGPFEPNATIQDEDGRDIRIDGNGYVANGTIAVTDEQTGKTSYQVYEGGVATGQSWEGLPERPAEPSTPPKPSAQSPVLHVADPPTSNQDETDAAAQAYYEAGVASPDGADKQREAFMAAVRAELATGASLEDIQARYGNDPYLNQAINEAAYGPA